MEMKKIEKNAGWHGALRRWRSEIVCDDLKWHANTAPILLALVLATEYWLPIGLFLLRVKA